jgi:predicted DNA-binding protein (MmcQ/YjbR family)
MNLEELRSYCLTFKGVTEDIKWENHLCFSVAKKIFFIGSLDETPIKASIKVDADEFDVLILREGIIPAPYMAKNKWIKIQENAFSDSEWKSYIEKSYIIIKAKLPKKIQQELN